MSGAIIKAGLIGQGISGSLTPAMHEAEGKAQGLDYRYVRIDTTLPELQEKPLPCLLRDVEERDFSGINITHPFKNCVVEHCDWLSDTAKILRSVNTVLFRDSKREGHNTDYIGFRSALRQSPQLGRIDNVLLIGAGGAGAAVALALIDQGCTSLSIYDLDQSKAEGLAQLLNQARQNVSIAVQSHISGFNVKALDGVVNATPLGMAGYPGTAIDPHTLSSRCWVADIVYFPLETALLRESRKRGLVTQSGAGMAVFQAVAAFNLITGKAADATRMWDGFVALSGAQMAPLTRSNLTLVENA